MFRKITAMILALTCSLSLGVTAFADTDLTGNLVDSDGNTAWDSSGTVRPGDDYYYVIGKSSAGYDILTNRDYITFSLKERTGSKYISDTELREKTINGTRYVCIEMSVKDNYTADEFKVVLESTFKAKKNMTITNWPIPANEFPILVPETVSRSGRSVGYIAQLEAALAAAKAAVVTAENAYKAQETIVANAKTTKDTRAANLEAAKVTEKQKQDAYDAEVTTDKDAVIAELKTQWNAMQVTLKTNQDKFTAFTTATANLQTYKDAQTAADALVKKLEQRKIDRAAIADSLGKLNAGTNDLLDAKSDLAMTTIPTYKTNYGVTLTATKTLDILKFFTGEATTISGLKATADSELTAANKNVTDATDAIPTDPKITQGDLDTLTAKVKELSDEITRLGTLSARAATDAGNLLSAWNAAKANTLTAQKALTDATTAYNTENGKLTDLAIAISNAKSVQNTAQITLDNAKKQSNTVVDSVGNKLDAGKSITNTITLWIQNEKREDSDATFVAGEKGVVIKPVKNELNTVTWENGNRNLARIVFTADSDADFYCPRLSTKWSSRADFSDEFWDQDTYVFDFVDNPRIPATTRAKLEIYNPFDGDRYSRKCYVYQVIDGELTDVTRLFDSETNDDDDAVLVTRTRTLGTYIVTDERVDLDDYDYDNGKDTSGNGDRDPDYSYGGSDQKPIPNTGR